MKNTKLSFWIVMLVGIMGIFASVFAFINGQVFLTYFLSGFSGILLILTAIITKNKRNEKE